MLQVSTMSRGEEIAAIDCFPVRMPLKKPLVMSTYRIDDGPALFVRIRSRGGAEGWGEAAANPIMSGETLRGMVSAVDELYAPRLIGRSASDRAMLWKELRSAVYGNGGALAAIDMALLDLAGKLANVPAVDLLGGAMRREVRPLWLIGGAGDVERDVADALALKGQDFSAFKLKVGVAPMAREVQIVAALREQLGEDVLLAADANMGWDVTTAIRFARAVEGFGLAFLEQPTPAGDVTRMAAVQAKSPIPIGADESLHSLGDILAHVDAGAIGGVSLKTIKLGGITPLVNAGRVSDALGLSVNLAMMMESSLATAAMIHAACAVPNVDWGLSLGNLWLADEPVAEPLAAVSGMARLSRCAGLGVEIDEKRLAAFAA